MNDHGITKENLLFTFPVGLRESETTSALGDVTARALAERPREIDRLTLYPRIDELPEDLLDILAYDFKVDWWDPNYTLEEKRRTLKTSWRVHKTLGTKAAVETAIRAIYPKAKVQEWFQYGGKPYYFKLLIDMTGEDPDPAKRDRVLERVNFYKNLRSHVDAFEYTVTPEQAALRAGVAMSMAVRIPIPEKPDTFDLRSELHTGGHMSATVKLPASELKDRFTSHSELSVGGAASSNVKISVPERQDKLAFQDKTSIGGCVTGQNAQLPAVELADHLGGKTKIRTGGGAGLHARLPAVRYHAAEPPKGV